LNFQLLSLIGGYRIAGKIDKLVNLLNNLCDSSTKVKFVKNSGIKLFLVFISCFMAWVMSLIVSSLLYLSIKGYTNWLRVSDCLLLWGYLCLFKIIFSLILLSGHLIEAIDDCWSIAKIHKFAELSQTQSSTTKIEMFRSTKPDFKASIIFKNVSYTMGFKLEGVTASSR